MIAAWMAYCAVLGVLVAGAAALGERVVDRRGGATRRVWSWAMGATVAMPLAGIVLRDGGTVDQLGVRAAAGPMDAAVMRAVDTLAVVDDVLLVAWIIGSVVAGLLVSGAVLRTYRRRKGWRQAVVDGVPVLVSRGVGPAVVGLRRGTIVLPEWALAATVEERSMILRHEQEHVRAGDPLLGLLGLVLVAVMPWSPALWWMAHRLHLAIEVDCDRRVVRNGGIDLRAYGTLLLTVGRRRSSLPLAAAAFSRPRSALEHRIDRMTVPPRRASAWRTALLGMAVVAILAGAWALPQPVRAADVDGAVRSCPVRKPMSPILRWS